MTLPENVYGVRQLVEQLSPLIVGQPRPGYACGCGDSRCETPTVASAIVPSGDDRPGLEVLWATWKVQMQPHDGGRGWTYPLDYFVDTEEVREMFRTYFGDAKFVPAFAV